MLRAANFHRRRQKRPRHTIASIFAIDKGADEAEADIEYRQHGLLSSVVGASSVKDVHKGAVI